MKKKYLVGLFAAVLSVSLTACANKEAENAEVNVQKPQEEVVEDTTNEVVQEDKAELSEEEKSAILEDYLDSLTKLEGSTFSMNLGYKDGTGLYDVIDGPSGTLYWTYSLNTDNLVTADYDSANNTLTFNSVAVTEEGETEVVSSVEVEQFIGPSDDTTILFSGLDTTAGQNLIMVENRGIGYTYADGVDYSLALVEIADDGTLNKIYDEGLVGSGDEDITSGIRAGFNKAIGKNYSQGTFEDAFYNGNLLISQEGMPIHAKIEFKSDSGKLADAGDWDGASAIASKIYDNMGGDVSPIYWGQGSFSR